MSSVFFSKYITRKGAKRTLADVSIHIWFREKQKTMITII
jgi:hypothetical protein